MRLFLAIDPGDDVRHRLAGVSAAVRAATTGGGVRWSREQQLHLTLSFLGDVPDGEHVRRISEGVSTVTAGHSPFTVHIEGGGVFPDWRRARVVWLGVRDNGPLTSLGQDIQRACAEAGFPPDHAFRAHLTIGRIPRPLRPVERDSLRRALDSLTETHAVEVTRVVLLRSEMTVNGSRYAEAASYPLRGP